jgi:1,4-alpha-glucan branching enzyme
MTTVPGKKLIIMGSEIGQWNEWFWDGSLDWHLLDSHMHRGVQAAARELNRLYRTEPALYELDCSPGGFEWIDCNDVEGSVMSFLRFAKTNNELVAVACNFTPVPRHNYMIGVPAGGYWKEIFNSDAGEYGGSSMGNFGGVEARHHSSHGRSHTLSLTLPPLSVVILKPAEKQEHSAKKPRSK